MGEETCVEVSNEQNRFFPHYQFYISDPDQNNSKWRKPSIINKKKRITMQNSVYSMVRVLRKPIIEHVRDSAVQLVFQGLLMITACLECF